MAIHKMPLWVVPLSASVYSLLYTSLRNAHYRQPNSARADNKLVSSVHSIAVTMATLVALGRDFRFAQSEPDASYRTPLNILDDSENPLIALKSNLANAITSWETGYLAYDTLLMLSTSSNDLRAGKHGVLKAAYHAAHKSPVILGHHLALLGALGALQIYIATGREKGIMVIMAFFLMNASNPLLHLRWFQKKTTGRTNLSTDIAMALLFALTRFGVVLATVKLYAAYHKMGTFDAFRRQRLVCRAGTGLLVSINAVWWIGLVMSISRRIKMQ